MLFWLGLAHFKAWLLRKVHDYSGVPFLNSEVGRSESIKGLTCLCISFDLL